MKNKFETVFLFGYSPIFKDIGDLLNRKKIKINLVFSNRQEDDINSIKNKISFCKIIKENNLKFLSKMIDDENYESNKILGISFGAPYIFKNEHINLFKGNLINSHGAPLPEFKGGGGFSWRIMQNDKRGSSLFHLINEGIDEGEVVFRKNFIFKKKDRYPLDFESTQLKQDKKNLLPFIESIVTGEKPLKIRKKIIQKKVRGSYFPRLLTKFNGLINWDWNGEDIQNFILAFSYPYTGAFCYYKKHKLWIFDCIYKKQKRNHPFTNGLILDQEKHNITIAVKDGILVLEKKHLIIDNQEKNFALGERLYSPINELENIRSSRILIKPKGPEIRNYIEPN